jgi:hypothetical protein
MPDPDPAERSSGPITSRISLGGWLSNLNNLLTAVGACVAAVAAIFSTINTGKIQQVETQVKNLELQAARQKASNEFANLFLDKVLQDQKLMGHEKHVQALLSILNIVAHPDDSAGAKARVMTPLTLALLMGEAGGLAAMDTDYELFDDWVAIAYTDNSPTTRVTAIHALAGVYYKALSQQRLDMMIKAAEAINQLYAMLPETPEFRAPANATRIELASFIKLKDSLITAAFVPADKKIPKGKSDEQLHADIRKAFSDAAQIGLDQAGKLTASVKQLVESNRPDAVVVAEKKNLEQLNAALAIAARATQEESQIDATTEKLIKDLSESDDFKRRYAQSQLALLGQNAVKPLLKVVKEGLYKNEEKDKKSRLGIATAFKLMKQPIALDSGDADWLSRLLISGEKSDSETRSNTAEFLMNLESGSSVRNCFVALENRFYEHSRSPDEDADTKVLHIASVVGTWARVITPDNPSPEPDKSFPPFALEKAKQWRKYLASTLAASDWEKTTDILDELIKKADSAANRSH